MVDGLPIFNNVTNESLAAFTDAWNELDEEQPRAFLNILFFDKDGKIVHYDFDQVSEGAKINGPAVHEDLTLEYEFKKGGLAYIFVSNHSNQNTEVYFDDLKVTHTYSDIVGGADFYPFGLTIEDRQITRELYRHGYQGQFAEKDDETGWNHFELREYDPVIGSGWCRIPKTNIGAHIWLWEMTQLIDWIRRVVGTAIRHRRMLFKDFGIGLADINISTTHTTI